jgi:hypothetical protein
MLLMQLNWLIIHKEGFCAKKWTKIGSILGAKTMFFLTTRRTLPKNPEKIPTGAISAKPRNKHFFAFKTYSFYLNKSQYHTQICLNQKTNEKKIKASKSSMRYQIKKPLT